MEQNSNCWRYPLSESGAQLPLTFSDFSETRSICKSDAFEKNQNNIIGYKDIDYSLGLKLGKLKIARVRGFLLSQPLRKGQGSWKREHSENCFGFCLFSLSALSQKYLIS